MGPIDPADTAWSLASTALVMLMAPGLALFYGGLVRAKNALGTMMQSFVALGVVSVLWVALGYSLAFGPDLARAMAGSASSGSGGWGPRRTSSPPPSPPRPSWPSR